MVNFSRVQAETLNTLLENFVVYENQNFGKITNILMMTNKFFKDSIFLRYEQTSSTNPNEQYDFELLEITFDGTIVKLNDKFKNAFERYAFLGECVAFDKNEIVVAD